MSVALYLSPSDRLSTTFRIGLAILVVTFLPFAKAEDANDSTALKAGPGKSLTITQRDDNTTTLKITGPHPHFWSQELTLPEHRTVLAFDYFSPEGIESLSVRFKSADGTMIFAGSQPVPLAETWQPFALDLSDHPVGPSRFHFSLKQRPGESLQIRNFRFRSPTPAEIQMRQNAERITSSREADASRYLNYLRNHYTAEISKVEVRPETIMISGHSPKPAHLVELPAHIPTHEASPFPAVASPSAGAFELELPRFDEATGRDRAVSRWRLDTPERTIASLAKWPSAVASGVADDSLPRLTAKGQKGLGGIASINSAQDPIFELGIDHATVNIVVDAVMFTEKKTGLEPWSFEGRTYYINRRFLNRNDVTIRHLRDREIIVTGILLVGNHSRSTMKHPEAEPRGTFAMPDLATEAGAHYYRAAIAFLTEHYATHQTRISNWVIHNEIDQHRTWTNMGEQPLTRYLETYARSARIVYHSARLHDPLARVFVSLTHHWTKPGIGSGAFTVRELVDLWTEIASADGENFDWGVAYHPYPQNLRDPDTWNDTDVTFDFDTPYITPKNLEVLPAYLGPDRPILLSEQGFNTPTLSEADQKRQAAGLVYTFRKLPHLPTVEAYHLHRYQDMPDREGGLRLGILDENGKRKIGWHTYAAIGTGSQAEIKNAAAADKIIPADVNNVSHPVKIIQTNSTPPNIVLIVADDLGWSDTTPYLDTSEDFYETPSVAELAARGMKFTNAYAASPLCSPTRASILTGQYPGRIRLTTPACHLPQVVLDPGIPTKAAPSKYVIEPATRTRFPNSYVTIAERLKTQNFATAFVGKWHLGHDPYLPDNQGFDRVIGGRGHPGPPGGFFAPWPIDTIPQSPAGSHIDDVITTESIKWLEQQKAGGKPFFLNLWYYSVHAPFQAKPDLIDKYRAKAKTLPANAQRANPIMAAMIETMDTNIGRITSALDRLGVSDNTLLIFTSDNGGNEYNYTEGQLATNNHPLRNGKGNIGEGGQRVPFIAVWPGQIAPASSNPTLVSSVDLFPTLLAATGGSPAPAQPVDGISLLPAFAGEADNERAIFCHFPHSPPATGTLTATSARRGQWKLTRFFADGPDQTDRLFLTDLDSDPGETTNLAEIQPRLAAELNQMITDHLDETEALVPIPNPAYKADFLGWTGNKDTILSRIDDALAVESTGNDPWLQTSDFAKAKGKVSIEIKMDRGAIDEKPDSEPPVLYWSTNKQKGYNADRSRPVPEISPGVYRLDLNLDEGDALSNIRLDPARSAGKIIIDTVRIIQWTTPGEGKTQRLWDF